MDYFKRAYNYVFASDIYEFECFLTIKCGEKDGKLQITGPKYVKKFYFKIAPMFYKKFIIESLLYGAYNKLNLLDEHNNYVADIINYNNVNMIDKENFVYICMESKVPMYSISIKIMDVQKINSTKVVLDNSPYNEIEYNYTGKVYFITNCNLEISKLQSLKEETIFI